MDSSRTVGLLQEQLHHRNSNVRFSHRKFENNRSGFLSHRHVPVLRNLIGFGPEVLENVEMVANDMKMDVGAGTCGKDGQRVPVGMGLPTVKCGGISVGGVG